MSKRFGIFLAVLAATLVSTTAALGYTPQPHQFAFQTTVLPFQACVVPGQNYPVAITVTNTGRTVATARVSTDPMGATNYQFGFVSASPTMNTNTTTFSDPTGASYSYTTYSWQRRLKPGKSAMFTIVVKAPDWNNPLPAYTDPITGQVVTPPAPEPYPTYFGLQTEAVGDDGAAQIVGLRLTYCGQQVPTDTGFGT